MNDTKIKDLSKLFTSRGFNVVVGSIYRQQQKWINWFRGEVQEFHYINSKRINGSVNSIRKPSLNMAKKVAEDLSGLLYNEKVELIVSNPDAQELIDSILKDNNFVDEMSNFIELTMVYGTGVIIEYAAQGKIKHKFIYGDKIMVVGYENSTITDIAVIDDFVMDDMSYTHVMIHQTEDDTYRVTHEMYATKAANQGLGKKTDMKVLFSEAEIAEMHHDIYNDSGEVIDVEYYLEYESKPHFQVFRPAITNNFDVKSPMGISAFANAIGAMQGADDMNFAMDRDSKLSMKRLFIDDAATKLAKRVDANGNTQFVKYFDEEEDIFQVLKGMTNDGNKAIESFAPLYDTAPHIEGIKLKLNLISFKCGLGTDFYSFENGSVYVNEANIISSNSDTWRNRQKHLNRLNQVLIGMMETIMFLAKDISLYNGDIEGLEYSVVFDDDIITDDATVLERLKVDALDGLIPEYLYIMKAYKLSKEEALALLEEANDDFEDDLVEPLIDDVPPTEKDEEVEEEE